MNNMSRKAASYSPQWLGETAYTKAPKIRKVWVDRELKNNETKEYMWQVEWGYKSSDSHSKDGIVWAYRSQGEGAAAKLYYMDNTFNLLNSEQCGDVHPFWEDTIHAKGNEVKGYLQSAIEILGLENESFGEEVRKFRGKLTTIRKHLKAEVYKPTPRTRKLQYHSTSQPSGSSTPTKTTPSKGTSSRRRKTFYQVIGPGAQRFLVRGSPQDTGEEQRRVALERLEGKTVNETLVLLSNLSEQDIDRKPLCQAVVFHLQTVLCKPASELPTAEALLVMKQNFDAFRLSSNTDIRQLAEWTQWLEANSESELPQDMFATNSSSKADTTHLLQEWRENSGRGLANTDSDENDDENKDPKQSRSGKSRNKTGSDEAGTKLDESDLLQTGQGEGEPGLGKPKDTEPVIGEQVASGGSTMPEGCKALDQSKDIEKPQQGETGGLEGENVKNSRKRKIDLDADERLRRISKATRAVFRATRS